MRWISLILCLSLSGCGWITGTSVGLTGGSSDSGSTPSNAQPNFGDVAVTGVRTSPATVRFTLVDNESDPVDVRLYYSVDGSTRKPMALVPGESGLNELATSRSGEQHTRLWDFEAQIGPEYREAVQIEVEIVSQPDRGELETPLVQTRTVALGNDAPEVVDLTVPSVEVVGIAAIDMTVRDSSSDLVQIQVEYDLLGDVPDQGFRPATPAGSAIDQIVAPAEGTTFTYFWDVVGDEGFTDSDVRLRITPRDGDLAGDSLEATLLLDNNTSPTALIDVGNFLANPDRRRGIPVSFEVFDGNPSTGEPGDDLRLVFQWRRPGELFPELPGTAAEIEAILDDPEQRRLFQIATEKPVPITGRTNLEGVAPTEDRKIRLRELLTSAHSAFRNHPVTGELSLEGDLEILRPSVPSALALPAGLIENPVAALSQSLGQTALVLDQPSSGGWRLQEIDLARQVAIGAPVADPSAGLPTTLAVDTREGSILIASETGGFWKIQRIEDGLVTDLYEADGTTELGEIRGLTVLRGESCLLTVGSSLIQLIYPPGEAVRVIELYSPTALKGPLQTPWGVLWDPVRELAFVAEHGADRVLAIALETLIARPLLARGLGFPAPESLTLDHTGAHLLVVTDEGRDGERELRGIEVNFAADRDTDGFADAEVYELLPRLDESPLMGTVGNVTTGGSGLTLLTLTSRNDLVVGGGIEQSRAITGVDYATQVVTVATPFDPPFAPGQPSKQWRIPKKLPARFPATPEGTAGVFVWDSEADVGGGEIALRLIPLDNDIGAESSTGERPVFASSVNTPEAIDLGLYTLGDLDGDGDLDSASDGDSGIALQLQTAPGVFSSGPILGGPSTSVLAVGDFDSDGDNDILANDSNDDALSIFFQTSPGEFSEGAPFGQGVAGLRASTVADFDSDGDDDVLLSVGPLVIYFQSSPGVLTPGPELDPSLSEHSLTVADLDSDGDLDIAVAIAGTVRRLRIYFQTTPGEFSQTIELNPFDDDGPKAIAAGDLDGDGDLDLVVGNPFLGPGGNKSVVTYLQTVPGAFELGDPIDSSSGGGIFGIASGDIDGDGDVDLMMAKRSSAEVEVFLQGSPGDFAQTFSIELGEPISDFRKPLILEDLDGDRRLDLVVTTNLEETRIIRQIAPGGMTLGLDLGSFDTAFAPAFLEAGDLDSDGDIDLVSGNILGNDLTVFFQTSPGTMTTGPNLKFPPTTQTPNGMQIGDLDGDGDLDVITANRRTGLTIFWQTAPGEFTLGPTLGDAETTPDPAHVAIADLDGDGDLDIVAGDIETDTSPLFLQTSPGIFEFETTVSGGLGVTTLDVDGDGDVDIATRDSDVLTFHLQTSPGTFEPGATVAATGSSDFGDFDGDGALDILMEAANDSIQILLQTSPLTFTQATTFVAGPKVGSLKAVDIDSDGDLDVVLIGGDSGGDGRMAIFYQTGPSRFMAGPVLTDYAGGNTTPVGVLAADLNSDGDPDVATANFVAGVPVSIFWGSQ